MLRNVAPGTSQNHNPFVTLCPSCYSFRNYIVLRSLIVINQTNRYKSIIIAVSLITYALRVYRLDAQSYWIDEGLTVFYANLSLGELMTYFQTVRATPPLYHTLTIF